MLFNSYSFIFLFLPITWLGFFGLARCQQHALALAWIVVSSLFFYAWWNPLYLPLLVGLISINYAFALLLQHFRLTHWAKLLLIMGIGFNLGILGYFKYANFLVTQFNTWTPIHYSLEPIVLPLAISFFTFQKIAFLCDSYRQPLQASLLQYSFFVTFFPQLIAGPITYQREILPQLHSTSTIYRCRSSHLTVGLTLFFVGLFKKVVLADNLAQYATPTFYACVQGTAPDFFQAWGAALAYTLQLYFDFSGYSDMALGLARLFGISLPINFYSPYKARNITLFWRRWHMTLSRFLRDYVYIPLGGNQQGHRQQCANLLITMLLGGFWHGAGWTFILWGALHGVYLVIHHAWRTYVHLGKYQHNVCLSLLATVLTFIAVTVAWVLFRAQTVDAAFLMYQSMLGFNGVVPPSFSWQWIWLGVGLSIVWLTPNVYQLLHKYEPAQLTYENLPIIPTYFAWQPSWVWALLIAGIAALGLLNLTHVSEFLYFQF